jgi:hypothetical protein
MSRSARIVAVCLLALAAAGCGRYGPPVRASQTAPAAAPSAPAPETPADPAADEPTEP